MTRILITQCIKAYLSDLLVSGGETTRDEKDTSPSTSISNKGEIAELSLRGNIGEVPGLPMPKAHSAGPNLTDFEPWSGSINDEKEKHRMSRVYSTSTPHPNDNRRSDMPEAISWSEKPLEISNRDHWGPQYRDHDHPGVAESLRKSAEGPKQMFKLVEDYIISSFTSRECINASFLHSRPPMAPRAASEGARRVINSSADGQSQQTAVALPEMDAKTLLLGNFAENGSWWTGDGEQQRMLDRTRLYHRRPSMRAPSVRTDNVNLKSPMIDWSELSEWYRVVLHIGCGWKRYLYELLNLDTSEPLDEYLSMKEIEQIEDSIVQAQAHTQRVLLKATESLLKRPGTPLRDPGDVRFLLIILANPLLYPFDMSSTQRPCTGFCSNTGDQFDPNSFLNRKLQPGPNSFPTSLQDRGRGPGQHSGIIKRVLGLLSNLPNDCHHHLVSWFGKFPESHFLRTTELVGSFVTYRLTRQNGKRRDLKHDPIAGLVPSLSASGQGASAALHAALGVSGQRTTQSDGRPKSVVYNDDWQLKAAARVMALLFSANNIGSTWKSDMSTSVSMDTASKIGMSAHERAHNPGQILPTSSFYNTLLDYSDLIADFEAWEARRGKFAFCQYPFFLSIWAKIQIMEYDTRRQMEVKAREAFFDSIMTRKSVNQYLVLKIRRDCLVEDSLKGVSAVVGAGGEEIKKGLRIEFKGEEGIDAGGLRKEWFLLLIRDIFNPEHGLNSLYWPFNLRTLIDF